MRLLLLLALITLPFIIAQDDLLGIRTDAQEFLQDLELPSRFSNPITQIRLSNGLLGAPQAWHECRPCVKHVADHIVNGTLIKLALHCAGTKDPAWKKRCEWISHHKNETLGYIVTKIRPVHDGYVFCTGAGQCPPHQSNKIELIEPTNEFDDNIMIHDTMSEYLSTFPTNDSSIEEWENKKFSKLISKLERYDDEPPEQKCHRCIKKSIKTIMKGIGRHFKRFCDKQKDPKIQKFCQWAAEHKGFIKGSLYARIEPWKYATGFCFGHGDCGKKQGMEQFFSL